ncbi:MAG: hypothetical protein Q8P31_04280 [Bacillota bacterium]|nr:hypothetical protein [Bacillota bacterium]
MDLLVKLGNIDRRVIYILLILATLVPLVRPIGLPFSVSEATKKFYAAVEQVPAGETILMAIDYSVGGGPDIHPQGQAVFRHAMARGLKVVFVAFVTEGTEFANQIIAEGEKMAGKTYGVDFVNLGYVPGSEVAISAFAQDVLKVYPKDVRGNVTADLPIMQGIATVADFVLVTEFATGIPGPSEWIKQVGTRYNVPLAIGVVTVMGPQTTPYYQAGQLVGLLSGLKSAAEYEVAMKAPGLATAAMDAQSIDHIVIVLFIILGNIAYFAGKGKKGR